MSNVHHSPLLLLILETWRLEIAAFMTREWTILKLTLLIICEISLLIFKKWSITVTFLNSLFAEAESVIFDDLDKVNTKISQRNPLSIATDLF